MSCSYLLLFALSCMTVAMAQPGPEFAPLPEGEHLSLAWPTPNRFLVSDPVHFFAATRANPDYGKPGWTRDCGRRIHLGCDIAPIRKTATGKTTAVEFTNCDTGEEYESEEPTYIPHDPVACVYEGVVEEAVVHQDDSDFGMHVVIRHRWPGSGEVFYTLYGHLAGVSVKPGQELATGEEIGLMGTTSRSADARNWMAIAPHLHFEVWDAQRRAMHPVAFLESHLP